MSGALRCRRGDERRGPDSCLGLSHELGSRGLRCRRGDERRGPDSCLGLSHELGSRGSFLHNHFNDSMFTAFFVLSKSMSVRGHSGQSLDSVQETASYFEESSATRDGCLIKSSTIAQRNCGPSRHSWYSCASIVWYFPVIMAKRYSISGAKTNKLKKQSQKRAPTCGRIFVVL